MGKQATLLTKKNLEMAMIEIQLAKKLIGDTESNNDALSHMQEAVKLLGRAGELLK